MPKFVLAVNKRGEKQRIPAAWLENASPFSAEFKLPPSGRASKSTSGEKSDSTQKES